MHNRLEFYAAIFHYIYKQNVALSRSFDPLKKCRHDAPREVWMRPEAEFTRVSVARAGVKGT